MRSVKRINLVFIALFVYSAVVQYNDPDPWLWATVYATAALACALFAFDRLPQPLAAGAAILALIGSVYLAARVAAFNEAVYEEQGREMGGLLIIGLWLAYIWLRRRSENSS